jgi:tetratricopeptide (TPR) repeat protein
MRDVSAVVSELENVKTPSGAASGVVAAETLEPIDGCDRASHTPGRTREEQQETGDVRQGLARVRALRWFGKPAEAAVVARELRTLAAPLRDEELLARLHLESSIAERENRRFDASEEEGYRAVTLAEAAGDDVVRARARSNLQIVVGYFEADSKQAARCYAQAMAAIRRLGGDRVLDAEVRGAHCVVLYGQHDDVEARDEAKRQAEGLEHSDNPIAVADSLRNVCVLERTLGRLDQAHAACERSIATLRAAVGDTHPAVGRVYGNLASVYFEETQFARALEVAQQAVAIYAAAAGPEGPNTYYAIVQATEAQALLGLERYTEALAAYERSLTVIERLGPRHRTVLQTVTETGFARLGTHDPERATADFERVLAAGNAGPPLDLAYAKLGLARALTELRREPARARTLAHGATSALEALPSPTPLQTRRRAEAQALVALISSGGTAPKE